MPKVKLYIPVEIYKVLASTARARGLHTYTFLKEIIFNEIDRILAPLESLASELESLKLADTEFHRVDMVVAPRDLQHLKILSMVTGKNYSKIACALILRELKVPQTVVE